ncbi:hypothetical protein [Oceaniglobus trochenteri]|uniref:hypothetical protein n=1 Tax=Oceaniglobus trochenteri TaxID=2763260 RepID=UPI001CFFAAAB|nr:hypothetical protein [Oceaniglobus trochenteri]
MKRANPVGLLSFAIATIAVLGGLGLWKGGLYMNWYEGDVLHLIEIVMRMAGGQVPHLDFMTPLGILSAWPIVVFVKAGLGVGTAFHAAQIAVALALLGPILRAAYSRFAGVTAYLFVLLMLVLPLALVHGGTDVSVSFSMHYNRWAWAFSLVALTLAVLPPLGARRQSLDGLLIGVLLAAVVLIKVTYLVALTPAVILALLLRGAARTLVVGLLAGVVSLGIVTLFLGFDFWVAYARDLLVTAQSEIRPHPDMPLGEMLTAPLLLGVHFLALAAVVLLRQGKRRNEGLLLLVLLPGLIYVTFQNFGNDPQWVLWLGLVLLMWRPDPGVANAWGWELRPAVTMTAAMLLALGAASFSNLAYSPLRHAAVATATYVPFFPRSQTHDDLFYPREMALEVQFGFKAAERSPRFALDFHEGDPAKLPTVLAGETLETCQLQSGMLTWFDQTARDLEKAGFADGSRIMVADLLSNMPLFSDSIAWVEGGAPWRYDGLPGIGAADYVLVPLCAVIPRVRQLTVAQLTEREIPLREVFRNDLFILMESGNRDQAIASSR